MRKTLCAFALTLMLCVATLAGEMPTGGNPPPPPPPPPAAAPADGTSIEPLILQTSEEPNEDETITGVILNLFQSMLALY